MSDKIVNHFVLADGSTAKYSAEQLAGDVPEVVDIRTGIDGTVYESAGDAVREQVSSVSELTANLFNGEFNYFYNMELSNGKVTNTVADTRTSYYCVVRFRNGDTTVTGSTTKVISTTGRASVTITTTGTGNNVYVLHNGSTNNLNFQMPFDFLSGVTYTVSFNVEGFNPSTVGGLIISDIQIEQGSTATDYVPHITAKDVYARNNISGIQSDISGIQSDISGIQNELYTFSEKALTTSANGYRLNESDGLCSSDASYKLVKYLVTAGDHLKVTSDDRWQFQTVASVPSTGTSNRIGETYGTGDYIVVVPEGATYLVGSTPTANSTFKVYNAFPKISTVKEDVLDENLLLYSLGISTLLTNNAYLQKTGAVVSNEYYKTSDYIAVKSGQEIKYNLNSNTTTAVICFFTAKSKDTIVSYVAGTASLSSGTFTVPADGYIRFSTTNASIPEAYCYIEADVSPNFAPDTLEKIFAGKKIVVFGDSIMADSSCASTIASVTGATVYNCAIGGTLISYCDIEGARDGYRTISGVRIAKAIANGTLQDIDISGLNLSYGNTQHWNTLLGIDFDEIDMAVVSYGTNDFSYNQPTDSQTDFDETAIKTAVDSFIKDMNTAYPNVQLCFFTPSYRHRTAWNGDSDEVTNGIGKYLVDYETAILTACGNNHVPCKAMYKSCGVNKYNYETYLSDGLHRTSAGGELLGHQYAGFLEDNVI